MTEKQKNFLKNYDFKKNLIIAWDVGIGKTYQARLLIQKYKKTNPDDLAYTITDTEAKEWVGSGAMRCRRPEEWGCSIYSFPLECLTRAKIVLYDDIGTAEPTEAYLRKLTYRLDRRTDSGLPTILTTNLSPKEIDKKYNERIKSRMYMNSVLMVMRGPDRRTANTIII